MDLASLAATSGMSEACEKLKGCDLTVDEVSSLCLQYRSELDQVKGELDRQVSGQVHDSSFANGMLSKAVQEMEGVSESLLKISQCCELVREKTPGFENLKRATVAKRNLHSVMEQLDLYGRVPNRVRRLMSELEREPRGDNLRRIFREWLGLSAWRDRVVGHVEDEATKAAQAEERAWRRSRGEILAKDTEKLAEEDSRTASSASFETMLALLKDHFRDSYVLGDRIFEIVNDSAHQVFDLARERPQDLVCVAEICERRDRQVFREMKRRGLVKDTLLKRHGLLQRLGEYADERAAGVLKQPQEDEGDDGDEEDKKNKRKNKKIKMRFDELIQACDTLLIDLQIIARDVRPCFPRTYDPLGVFRKWYEARLTREFSERIHDAVTEDELPSKEMLGLANWISRYVAAVDSFYSLEEDGAFFPKDVIGLERLCDNLLERYLTERALPRIAAAARMQEEREYAVMRIEPSRDDGVPQRGYLKTDHPEDFFSILNQEQHNSSDHFSGERSLKVFESFVQFALTWFLPKREQKLDLILCTKITDTTVVERVCAWMSDSARCQELVRLLFDTSADGLMRCEDVAGIIGRASDLVEDACLAFTQSGLKYSRTVLVETRIFADLDAQVFPEMFSKEWEESRYLGARVITATLDDWFHHPIQGLCDWISSEYLLGRTLLMCMEALIKRYVDALLKWKNKFGSAKRAAGRVEEDAKAFCMFFRKNIAVLKYANSASCRTEDDIERKFRIFHQLADILQGDEFNLEPLVESLGNVKDTKVVIKRLRALRGGRVFNRREADLEKDLGAAGDETASTSATSMFDIAAIEKLGDTVGGFEGELSATSFIESSNSAVSTEKQIAFVKKISAFARGTSFSQSKKKLPSKTGLESELLLGVDPAVMAAGIHSDQQPQTNVLSMNEFMSTSRKT